MTEIQLMTYLLPKIVAATVCGLIIGWERELKMKVAGIRTHIIVCVGACLYTAVGMTLAQLYHTDPSRIIAQIVTGIGFLGAGVIFKQEDKVVGVTSAAFIWLVASIGVLVGIGYPISSVVFTLGFLMVLLTLQKLEKQINKYSNEK